MEGKELLQEKVYEITISSTGKSHEEVYQNLFKQLRSDIHGHIDGYLVEMHVESVILRNIQEERFTKKFLFFFLPVEHVKFNAEAVFKVKVAELLKERDQ